MKKNKMMRLASAMMVLTLMSTSVISGTFAKYTTQDSGSDVARVAKWGVELQVVGDLYGETYKDAIVADNDGTLTVQAFDYSTAEDNVVAPGTKNENGFSVKLNGTPEVDGKVVTKIAYENIYLKAGTYGLMVEVPKDVVTAQNFAELGTLYKYATDRYVVASVGDVGETLYTLEDNVTIGENYYPVEYKMTGDLANYNTLYDTAISTDTLAGVVNMLIPNLGTLKSSDVVDGLTSYEYEKMFDANQNLDDEVLKMGNQNIQWKWDYCQQTTCPDGDNACGFCKADTILGNLATTGLKVVKLDSVDYVELVEHKDYCLDTQFSIDITVTQVD